MSQQHNKKLTLAEKISEAEKVKLVGNDAFRNGNTRQAIKKYHVSLLYLKDIENPSPLDKMSGNVPVKLTNEELHSVKSLRCSCYNNLAACLLKKENYPKVVQYATEALNNDSTNVKALFRRGQAYFALKDIDRAELDFFKIKEIDFNETCVDKYFPLIGEAKFKQSQKEKEIYRKMMATT